MKAEPSRLIPRKFAANLQRLIVVHKIRNYSTVIRVNILVKANMVIFILPELTTEHIKLP